MADLGHDSWRECDDEVRMKMNAKMALTITLQDVGRRVKVYQMDMLQDYKRDQQPLQ